MAKTKDDKFQVVKVINAKNQQFQKICHWSRSITHCRQLCRRAKSVALCCNAADKLSISRPVLSGCTFSLLSSHSWPPSAMISFGFLLFSFSVICNPLTSNLPHRHFSLLDSDWSIPIHFSLHTRWGYRL